MKRCLIRCLLLCVMLEASFLVAVSEDILYPWEVNERLQQSNTTEEKIALLERMTSDNELLCSEREFSITKGRYCRELLETYFLIDRPATMMGEYTEIPYLSKEQNDFEQQRGNVWRRADEAQGIETTRVFGAYIVNRVREMPNGSVQVLLDEHQYVFYRLKNAASDESFYQREIKHVLTLAQDAEWYIVSDAYYETGILPCSPDFLGCGDWNLNGKLDTTDARVALQVAAGRLIAAEMGGSQYALDVDQNGKIDTTDSRLILQCAAGRLDAFPISATK